MMQPNLRLIPKPALTVSARLCGVVGLLRMNNEELSRHMADMAARNPLLDVKPRGQGSEGMQEAQVMAAQDSLYGHVLRQISVTIEDPTDLHLANLFAEALEPSGWLGQSVAAIARNAGVDVFRAERVLNQLQGFEPTGLFARDLADCLRLQLVERGTWDEATSTVLAHLACFLEGGADALVKKTGLSEDVIGEILSNIRACNPKPGAAFQPEDPGLQRRPDVVVTRGRDVWQIELDRSTLPSLDLMDSSAARDPVLARLRADARWLINAVRLRNRMTLNVARAVISHQIGFLERGAAGLKPLRRREVADRLGVHESTVGRVATGLLVQTPSQMLELTRFFSRTVSHKSGEGISRCKIMKDLGDLIAAESPSAPLTDRALAEKLSEAGIRISRRTIAKYRQKLGLRVAAARAKNAMVSI
ncbi:MAG: RNA polymerase factor sigma-54 [Pseudomonadota bacterium]